MTNYSSKLGFLNDVPRRKVALITGITGQDGSYLAELLLEKGYEVHGIMRRSSSFNTGRIDHIFDKLKLHYGDVTDGLSMLNVITDNKPDEIYHLAAQSHVGVSFQNPEYTMVADGMALAKLLESIRCLQKNDDYYKNIKIYNACTSEMFGTSPAPQNEVTPFKPCSPYGIAKLQSYWTANYYRQAHGMFVSNGILFNHESPRRGGTFVTQKIVQAAIKVKKKQIPYIALGNLEAVRDWGHAKDYVEAMHLMLQHDISDDFVIATGIQKSVRDVVNYVFSVLDIELNWMRDIALHKGTAVVFGNREEYIRPYEVPQLCGDATKAKTVLNWQPQYTFESLLDEMINYELSISQ